MISEFTVSAFFDVAPEKLYDAWLDSDQHSKMTGSPANVSDQINSDFQAWGGYISGKNLELDSGKRILQFWRTSEFSNEEVDSKIEITFVAENSGTKLSLRHWDLPEHGAQYESGWQESYFDPMKDFFKA